MRKRKDQPESNVTLLGEGRRYRGGIVRRCASLPMIVFTDSTTRESRCINGAHVQTFVANPFGNSGGTLITFINGDRVTVTESFDDVVDALMGDSPDG